MPGDNGIAADDEIPAEFDGEHSNENEQEAFAQGHKLLFFFLPGNFAGFIRLAQRVKEE